MENNPSSLKKKKKWYRRLLFKRKSMKLKNHQMQESKSFCLPDHSTLMRKNSKLHNLYLPKPWLLWKENLLKNVTAAAWMLNLCSPFMMKTSKKRIQGLLICMFTDGLGSQRVRFYLNAEVTALPAIGSDHSPLILSTLHAQMGASKAPGPDGLNGLFFHQHWQDIGADVFREVHRFFESEPLCPICKLEPETIEHTLMLCPWTTQVWNDSSLKSAPNLVQCHHIKGLFLCLE